MNKLLLPMSTILLACCCCPFGAIAPNFATEEPEPEKVVGVYELSDQYVVSESVVEDKIYYLELYPDQTCDMVNFPVFVEDRNFEYKLQQLYTGKCSWKITTTGGTNKGWDVVSIWGICFNDVNFVSTDNCANLLKNTDNFDLEFVFGDPDSNRMMIFSRITPK